MTPESWSQESPGKSGPQSSRGKQENPFIELRERRGCSIGPKPPPGHPPSPWGGDTGEQDWGCHCPSCPHNPTLALFEPYLRGSSSHPQKPPCTKGWIQDFLFLHKGICRSGPEQVALSPPRLSCASVSPAPSPPPPPPGYKGKAPPKSKK